mmetsp:Transcript_40003/g.95046  ORF Transcript_40003/g.95046 Transcript_40003/m.95046 type:complete len:212 (+) Transcript_40003:873-1508(+)
MESDSRQVWASCPLPPPKKKKKKVKRKEKEREKKDFETRAPFLHCAVWPTPPAGPRGREDGRGHGRRHPPKGRRALTGEPREPRELERRVPSEGLRLQHPRAQRLPSARHGGALRPHPRRRAVPRGEGPQPPQAPRRRGRRRHRPRGQRAQSHYQAHRRASHDRGAGSGPLRGHRRPLRREARAGDAQDAAGGRVRSPFGLRFRFRCGSLR